MHFTDISNTSDTGITGVLDTGVAFLTSDLTPVRSCLPGAIDTGQ
jgi:hypothetical protein